MKFEFNELPVNRAPVMTISDEGKVSFGDHLDPVEGAIEVWNALTELVDLHNRTISSSLLPELESAGVRMRNLLLRRHVIGVWSIDRYGMKLEMRARDRPENVASRLIGWDDLKNIRMATLLEDAEKRTLKMLMEAHDEPQ